MIRSDRSLLDLSDAGKRDFLSRPEDADHVDDPILLVSFEKNRGKISFFKLAQNLSLAFVALDRLFRRTARGEPFVQLVPSCFKLPVEFNPKKVGLHPNRFCYRQTFLE